MDLQFSQNCGIEKPSKTGLDVNFVNPSILGLCSHVPKLDILVCEDTNQGNSKV